MNTIVLATHNAGKLAEFRTLLAPLGVEVKSAGELHLPEPEETGTTFEENAELKARAAAAASGLPALADDSGLVIPAIGGAPGVYSARWAPNKHFHLAFERIQRELLAAGASPNAPAHFMCVLCLVVPTACEPSLAPPAPSFTSPASGGGREGGHGGEQLQKASPLNPPAGGGNIHLFTGRVDGTLTFPPRGEKGFGYDPIFTPIGYSNTFAELPPETKNALSHRARACEKLVGFLRGT